MSRIDSLLSPGAPVRTRRSWLGWALALLVVLAAVGGSVIGWRSSAGSLPFAGSGEQIQRQSLEESTSDGPPKPGDGAVIVALRPALSSAIDDPFVLPVASTPVAPPPVYVEPVVMAAPVQQLPSMPSLKFTGVMHGVDGEVVVAAQWDDGAPVFLRAGDVLDNGFRVESVSKQSVQLKHTDNLQVLVLPLPASPRFEIR